MNFYTTAHKHYCGIDLHARTMYVCVLSQQGVVLLHRNLPCDAQRFLLAVQPFREDLVVAVEPIINLREHEFQGAFAQLAMKHAAAGPTDFIGP